LSLNRRVLAAQLAIASLWATSACAQTVYGTVDLAAGRFKGTPTGVNGLDRPMYQLASGGLTTSYFGIRGAEDLGDGLSAQFDLASFFRADTGASGRSEAIGPPVNVAADPFFSKYSWVGLASPAYGRIRLGNITTLLFLNSITSNAFGDSTAFSPLVLTTFIGGPLTGGTAWTNQVAYESPTWHAVSFALSRNFSEGQGGHNQAARVSAARGPWAAGVVWQSVKKNPLTFADGTSPNNTSIVQLTGSYDFDIVKVFAHAARLKNEGTETAPVDVTYKLWDLSASVPLGLGYLQLGYAHRGTSDAVAPVPRSAAGGNVERNVFTSGYDYFLSKRTDLYAMLMSDKTRTNVVGAPPAILAATGFGAAMGIRHRF